MAKQADFHATYAALSVAIAEILEDCHEAAVMRARGADDMKRRATRLRSAGEDITALAAALHVVARRGADR